MDDLGKQRQVGLLLDGKLEPEEVTRTVRHLLDRRRRPGAGRFRSWTPLLAADWKPGESGGCNPEEYDEACTRAFAAARLQARQIGRQAREREKELRGARRALAAILESEGTGQDRAGRYTRWMQGPAWVEAILEQGLALRYSDPARMEELARWAQIAAGNLEAEAWGADRVAACQARAHLELANALRIRERFEESRGQLRKARRRLADLDEPFLSVRCDRAEAALAADQRRLGDACNLLEEVVAFLLQIGEARLAGEVQIQLAAYLLYSDAPREALQVAREGHDRILPERDPQLAAMATQTLVSILVENGQYPEASRLLLASGLREKLAGQTLSLLKLRWLEGQIAAGLGKADRAIGAFEAVREGFLAEGQTYRAALVGLELAELWLQQGKMAETRDLAEEMLETFEDLEIEREARRAVHYFHRACAVELATPAVARHVAGFLRRLEHQPHLRFAEL